MNEETEGYSYIISMFTALTIVTVIVCIRTVANESQQSVPYTIT